MNKATHVVTLLTTLALLSLVTAVQAQPTGERRDTLDTLDLEAVTETKDKPRPARRHARMALEASAMLAIGTAWYWRRDGNKWGGANVVDWQLGFERGALGKKLGMSRDGWRFDGNSFGLNAAGHPMFGALTYFSARNNRYTAAESFLISTIASGAWELFTEWAEYGSINDALSTSTTGVPVGEAAYQLIHGWRKARYGVQVGAGTEAGEGMLSLAGAAKLDTVPGRGAGWAGAGKRVSIGVEVPFDGAVRSVEGGAKSSLVGHYRNGAHHRLFAGVSSEFYYRDRKDRDGRAWDLLSTISVGPTVDLQMRRGDVTIDVGADAYVNFGMVKAQAHDAWREANPMALVRNSMQDKAKPYYYARGVTVAPRIHVAYRGVQIGGKLAASRFDSLDGADRDQEMLTADPHIQDTDASAEAWAGYTHRAVTVAVNGRVHTRSGSIDDASAEAGTRTSMVTLSFQR